MNIFLQYLYSSTNQLPKKNFERLGRTGPDDVQLAILTYITANKYVYFPLANAVMEVFMDRGEHITALVTHLEQLKAAGLENKPLHRFLLKKLCYDLKANGWEQYVPSRNASLWEDLMKAPELWLAITKSLSVKDKTAPVSYLGYGKRWQFLVDGKGDDLTEAAEYKAAR